MKKLLLATLVTFGLTVAAPAQATDFGVWEHNTQLSKGDYSLEVRNRFNDDYFHFHLVKKVYKNFKVSYRHAQGGAKKENRIRVENKINLTDWLYVTPRVEYRIFNAKGDDHLRVRPEVGVKYNVQKVSLYANWSPMWSFGVPGQKFTRTKTKVGFDYSVLDQVSIGPFYQLDTDGDWNKKSQIFGSTLKIKL